MGGNAGTGKKGADINVVPLIDIVLVLLIIFMVITPLIVKQMDVHTPDTDPQPDETPPPPDPNTPPQVILLMGADGKTYIGKDEVEGSALAQRLTNIYQGRKEEDKVLFFDAQNNTNYGAAVKVLDLARGAGANKIGIVTDRTNLPTDGDGEMKFDAAVPTSPVPPTPPGPAPKK